MDPEKLIKCAFCITDTHGDDGVFQNHHAVLQIALHRTGHKSTSGL